MDYIEALIGVLIALAALIGAVALAVRVAAGQAARAADVERKRTDELISELRRDITQRTEEAQRALQTANRAESRIVALETASAQKDNEIASLKRQLDTVCTQLDVMQTRLDKAESARESAQKLIDELQEKIKMLEKENERLFEANKLLQMEARTYKSALALVGERLIEQKTEPESATVADFGQESEDTKPEEAKNVGQ